MRLENEGQTEPIDQLRLLKAAGVKTLMISPPTTDTALDKVLAIGQASREAMKSLSREQLAQATKAIALDRER